MACGAFDFPAEMVDGDIVVKDSENDEYIKRCSHFATPVLEDGECTVMDGYEILQYIAEKYDTPLYPKDEEKRKLINEKMMLCMAFFLKLCSATYGVFEEGKSGPTEEDLQEIEETYGFVELLLTESKFVAGDEITIADIAAIADLTSLALIVPIDAAKYPKFQAWVEEMKKLPYVQKYNAPGLELLGNLYKEKLGA